MFLRILQDKLRFPAFSFFILLLRTSSNSIWQKSNRPHILYVFVPKTDTDEMLIDEQNCKIV